MSPTEVAPAAILAGLASFAASEELSVTKDGHNPHFNYNFATEPALFRAARAALDAAGLSATISFEGGQHEIITTTAQDRDGNPVERTSIMATVTARLTIRDQQGNQVECTAYGQGMDPADKAYPKAQTMAAKYVCAKAFMIAIEGDDADAGDSGSVAGRQGGGSMTGAASDKQLGFLCSLVKKGHYVESKDAPDVEHMALRLARMEGDTAESFVKISKAAASSLIEKLQRIPDHRTGEVLEKLAQWEAEHGTPTAEAEAAASATPVPPAAAPDDDDTPF